MIARFVSLALLSACAAAPAPSPVAQPAPIALEDTCRAAPQAKLIGQDATALERVLILGQVRIIRPGSAVTLEYRPERINFEIGADNSIRKITCG